LGQLLNGSWRAERVRGSFDKTTLGRLRTIGTDPYSTAGTQYSAFNIPAAEETLNLNTMNSYGPYGSSTFSYGPNGTPDGITMNLDPQLAGTVASGQEGALGRNLRHGGTGPRHHHTTEQTDKFPPPHAILLPDQALRPRLEEHDPDDDEIFARRLQIIRMCRVRDHSTLRLRASSGNLR
jgi:hypothetical protein